MNPSLVSTSARRAAAAATRRSALLALAAPALAAGLGPAAVVGKGKSGKAGKKARKRCQRQRGQCLNFVETRLCVNRLPPDRAGADGIPEDSCLEVFRPCCDLLAKCQAGQALTCLSQPL